MTNYLQIINENDKVPDEPNTKKLYNLFTSKVQLFPQTYHLNYPFDFYNINMNSEVLIRIPHLTPNYFVKCT